MTNSLYVIFSRDKVARLAGQRVLGRAILIRPSLIQDVEITEGRISATVRGTLPYTSTLWVDDKNRPRSSCNCPQGDDGKFCKHCAAVGLSLHVEVMPDGAQPFPEDESSRESRPLRGSNLSFRTNEEDPAIPSEYVANAAAINVKECRRMIDHAFGSTSRFVDYESAPRWATRVFEVLQLLDELIDDGGATDVVGLLEYAFTRTERAMQHVDDSDGWITSISMDIAEAHLRACRLAPPRPKTFARRLAKLELDFDLDTFRGAAQRYAQVLGRDGLAEYRTLINAAESELGSKVHDRWSSEVFRVREARIGLAFGSGDVDELIGILDAPRLVPHDCVTIVDALQRAGRSTEALHWARRGLATPGFSEHSVGDLRTRLADLLIAEGDVAGAREVRLEGFHASPTPHTLHMMLELCDPVERDTQRREAIDWLSERARSRPGNDTGSELVKVLLFEGDIDDAFDASQRYGCSSDRRLTLARALERTRPADAISLYEPEVEKLIDRKTRNHYLAATSLLARVQSLYLATQNTTGWDRYLIDLATAHRAKRSLMIMLRAQGWRTE